MGIMRGVLACVVAVLAIFIGILLVVGGSAQIFLHPGAYQHALQESGAYKLVDEMNSNKSMIVLGMVFWGISLKMNRTSAESSGS